jgi:hypothetical protein
VPEPNAFFRLYHPGLASLQQLANQSDKRQRTFSTGVEGLQDPERGLRRLVDECLGGAARTNDGSAMEMPMGSNVVALTWHSAALQDFQSCARLGLPTSGSLHGRSITARQTLVAQVAASGQ